MTPDSYLTRQRTAPVIGHFDVVVAGAGAAGIAAALSSAAKGARTALVERYGFFGGNAVSAYVGTICGLYLSSKGDYVSGGLARRWAEMLMKSGFAFGPVPFKQTAVAIYVPFGFKRQADALIAGERLIEPFLHSSIVDVDAENGHTNAVLLGSKRGPLAIEGDVFIDTTGDADVAFHAGLEVHTAAKDERQFPSMQFLMGNVDFERARVSAMEALASEEPLTPSQMSGAVTGMLSRLLSEQGQAPEWNLTRTSGALFPTFRPGEVLGAMTRISSRSGGAPDMTDVKEATYAEIDGRGHAEKAHDFLKTFIPGFEQSFIVDTPTQLGVRETRRIVGEHLLSHEEVIGEGRFDDAVGCACWPEEFHHGGKDTQYVWLDEGAHYQLPLRMLIAKGSDNLLMAGRCSSAEPEAHASSRVIATAMVQGEAAGVAAALAAKAGTAARDVDPDELRSILVKREAVI